MRSCAHEVPTVYILRVKNYKVHNVEKSKKKNLTIISKPHAHPHNMNKTHARFHNNRYKTLTGVALTRGTNYLYIKGEKWLCSQCWKSHKTYLTIISKPHAYPDTLKKTFKVSKRSVQNCKRSCTHKRYPLSEYWRWKWPSSQCKKKSDKKCSNNYTQTKCTTPY